MKEKGVSLYFALIIMFILISIGLGISLIIVSQMKMMREMGDSVVAFHAADTGIENALYQHRKQASTDNIPLTPLPGGASSYTASFYSNPITQETMWQSVGSYQGVKRAIKITYPLVFDFSISLNESGGYWCPAGGISPEPITVTTQIISGDPNRQMNFSVTVSDPKIEVKFDKPGCLPVTSCPSANCSSTLCFSFLSPSENYGFTVTITGETDIKSKSIDFLGAHDAPPCAP
jgi:hypothetical protein